MQLFFLLLPSFPTLLQALCPWPSLATGNRSRKEPVDTQGGTNPSSRFRLVPSVPPHIYAFTFIFCYRCIHYSKGNVSCFTSIKLYKLEAWPPFVPQGGSPAVPPAPRARHSLKTPPSTSLSCSPPGGNHPCWSWRLLPPPPELRESLTSPPYVDPAASEEHLRRCN